jgi:hypothetical protein
MLTDQYNATIVRTLELCGMTGVPELFSEAEKLERENFSLYNYVVEHGARQTRLQEEIDGLELQHRSLVLQTNANDEEQSVALEELTTAIQQVDADLTTARDEKAARDVEFASVYTEVEAVFNLLACDWTDAPDGKTTVTPLNAMFCLSAIEGKITEMMNTVFEKTRLECSFMDIKPASFIADGTDAQTVAKHPSSIGTRTPEKEPARVVDSPKPLSLDELRAMLE